MTPVETTFVTEKYRERCEDRVAVFNSDCRTVIVVADGAGGMGAGDIAAETVIRQIEFMHGGIHSADEWSAALKQIDFRIGDGEATSVVADIRPYGIAGSSVGDSQAWIFADGSVTKLTENQNRKPLLGSGHASPVSFMHPALKGVLLIATDGFFDYAKLDAITQIIYQSDFYTIPRTCVELVRLPSGDLWDDIGIVAARVRPPDRSPTKYII